MTKLLLLLLLAFLVGAAGAFAPFHFAFRITRYPLATAIAVVITGPEGTPASSSEEDLFRTLEVIMNHDIVRSTARTVVDFANNEEISYNNESSSVDVDDFGSRNEETKSVDFVIKEKLNVPMEKMIRIKSSGRYSSSPRSLRNFTARLKKHLHLPVTGLMKRIHGLYQKSIWKFQLRSQ